MNQEKVFLLIETICNMGCTTVNATIHTIESGNTFEGTKDFNEAEITTLVKELKAIMSIYENRD